LANRAPSFLVFNKSTSTRWRVISVSGTEMTFAAPGEEKDLRTFVRLPDYNMVGHLD
jgi:hypothetical protein